MQACVSLYISDLTLPAIIHDFVAYVEIYAEEVGLQEAPPLAGGFGDVPNSYFSSCTRFAVTKRVQEEGK